MKKFLFLLLLPLTVLADQRFETHQGLCHFAYDPADDDNEIYFANCINTINTHDAGDGQGRLAYGNTKVSAPEGMALNGVSNINHYLKGTDAMITLMDSNGEDTYQVSDTPCVMVTSNYDAGNDDDNETVYVTNDWDMQIVFNNARYRRHKDDYLVFRLECRGGVAQ